MPRLVFAFCCAAMMVLAISINLLPVCLPLLSTGFGDGPLNKEQLGRIAATAFAGLVAGLLLTGPVANRHPAKWFAAGGCLCIAAGLGLLGRTHSYDGILVAVAVMGFGGGVLDMILSPIVCAIRPEQRTIALNWLHSFYCVGAVVTVLAATLWLKREVSWQKVAWGMTVPAMAVGIVFFLLPVPALLKEPGQRQGIRALFRERFFLLALLTIFLGGSTEMGVAQWLPAFAELELGFSRAVGGSSLLAFSVAMALGRMVVGLLNNRFSMYRVMAWSCATTGLLLLVTGFCPARSVALSAAVVAGFTGSCLWPSTLGVTADRYPFGGASMFGLLAALGNFGGISMPWGVGAIADHSSLALGLAATAICPLAMLITLTAMFREKARDDARSALAAAGSRA